MAGHFCAQWGHLRGELLDHCLQAPDSETQADAAAARVILQPRSMADMQVFLDLSAFTAALLPVPSLPYTLWGPPAHGATP